MEARTIVERDKQVNMEARTIVDRDKQVNNLLNYFPETNIVLYVILRN